jgi:hypothetical protein
VNFKKGFFVIATLLFGSIGTIAFLKKKIPEERKFLQEVETVELAPLELAKPVEQLTPQRPAVSELSPSLEMGEVDRIPLLFALDSTKLPIVETISFTSRVPWLKGRHAWIADYASHYSTSRHFIARSLNQKPDYLTQKISPGDRFNVFRAEANFKFHLVLDLSTCRLWFYYINSDTNERTLLKVYRAGVGREDSKTSSKSLTPTGMYHLGERVAIYKAGVIGFFQNHKTEMIRVFGSRWIPFDRAIEGCTQEAYGLGIHGAPWIPDAEGTLVEDRSKIGKYDSDGCIRMNSEDIEELFAIVITKETTIEIVKEFREAKLPGVEKVL